MTNHDTNPKKQSEWDRQSSLAKKIIEIGATEFFLGHPNIKKPFGIKKNRFVCMDEGTAHQRCESGNFGLAGSGILYPGCWKERVERIAKIMLGAGVNEVTSHTGCGAAGIAFNQAPKSFLQKNCIETADDLAYFWSAELAKVMHKKNPGLVHHRHIGAEIMARPTEFHNAVCAWYNLTEDFDPSRLGKNSPNGFLHEPGLLNKHDSKIEQQKYTLRELALAIKIAFGHHGFGLELFNEKLPFLVIVVACDNDQLASEKSKIEKFLTQNEGLKELASDPLKIIHIDGFVRPRV
ncbi:MAG: hypothetical protein Q7T50_03270 [Candidatus Magasanikbacteria bacterium]|nr:hypothetical protein [Candidatus Magasanikbacteria bacterium]